MEAARLQSGHGFARIGSRRIHPCALRAASQARIGSRGFTPAIGGLQAKATSSQLGRADRLFWTVLARVYSGWADALIVVKPETVVSWHRASFRHYVSDSESGSRLRKR